jgi:hypothetical protein
MYFNLVLSIKKLLIRKKGVISNVIIKTSVVSSVTEDNRYNEKYKRIED